jgi:hypothetical protein
MSLTILERSYSPPLPTPVTDDAWMQFNHVLDGCLEARDIHWQFSLVAAAGDRSLCLFEVPYAELVREACRESCMPFQRVWPVEMWG